MYLITRKHNIHPALNYEEIPTGNKHTLHAYIHRLAYIHI